MPAAYRVRAGREVVDDIVQTGEVRAMLVLMALLVPMVLASCYALSRNSCDQKALSLVVPMQSLVTPKYQLVVPMQSLSIPMYSLVVL